MTSSHQTVYDSWVSHISDANEKKSVLSALLDCTPASALISLVHSDITNIDNATQAFRNKYSIRVGHGWLGLQAEAQSEEQYCKSMDI